MKTVEELEKDVEELTEVVRALLAGHIKTDAQLRELIVLFNKALDKKDK